VSDYVPLLKKEILPWTARKNPSIVFLCPQQAKVDSYGAGRSAADHLRARSKNILKIFNCKYKKGGFCLLGCNAVQFGKYQRTRYLVHPSSG
jgi:hypothetical protein